MKSKITGGATEKVFTAKILNKYQVDYFKCIETGFLQTEEPYWLEEAYSSAITKLDVGMVQRNEILRDTTIKILMKYFKTDAQFLDYAGGYGLFTRMMRDKGFNFFHIDPYCKNIFAEYFELDNLINENKIELVTSFEVFEHLSNPLEEIKLMLNYSDSLLFTTELVPDGIKQIDDWWYFIPETGQHIALYTKASLAYLANELGCQFYTDGLHIHLFTKKVLNKDPFKEEKLPYLIRTMKRKVERFVNKLYPPKETLLQRDWQMIKERLK